MATVIFSHVKVTCYFHMWRYQVFVWKLTWYFIGVYIINNNISLDLNTYFISGTLLSGWSNGRFWKSAWHSTILSFLFEFSNLSSSSTKSSCSSPASSSSSFAAGADGPGLLVFFAVYFSIIISMSITKVTEFLHYISNIFFGYT